MNIIGCGFHVRFQQISMDDTATRKMIEKWLDRESGEAKGLYESLKEPEFVGIEATGVARWFAEMLEESGRQLVVGEAARAVRPVMRFPILALAMKPRQTNNARSGIVEPPPSGWPSSSYPEPS